MTVNGSPEPMLNRKLKIAFLILVCLKIAPDVMDFMRIASGTGVCSKVYPILAKINLLEGSSHSLHPNLLSVTSSSTPSLTRPANPFPEGHEHL